jgi:hypothetical protein
MRISHPTSQDPKKREFRESIRWGKPGRGPGELTLRSEVEGFDRRFGSILIPHFGTSSTLYP